MIIKALGVGVIALILLGCQAGVNPTTTSQSPDAFTVDFAIAYVKRSVPRDQNNNRNNIDVREPAAFNAGARLFVRASASPSATEFNVTDGAFGTGAQYDVKDVSVSYDGTKVLFAMRAPDIPGADDEDQPKWNIWEYNYPTNSLRRIMVSDNVAEAGQDIAPHYLPDGRIIFSSTRQRRSKATLLDENKPQYSGLEENRQVEAFVLHVMNADGSDIDQVSFNQSHDLDPTVLPNGKVVFSRWDNFGSSNSLSLYRMNPDGSQLERYYGYHSQDTGTAGSSVHFLRPQALEDGRIMALLKEFDTNHYGAQLTFIDAANYLEHDQPTYANLGAAANGQSNPVPYVIRTDSTPSVGGRFSAATPMYDGTNRLLVGWTPCRLIDPADQRIVPCTADRLANNQFVEADPLYGVWIYDISAGTQLPVVTVSEGELVSDVAILQPQRLPTIVFDGETLGDSDQIDGAARAAEVTALSDNNQGILEIRSVYDIDGTDASGSSIVDVRDPFTTAPDNRTARFIRLVKAVPIPDDNVRDFANTAFGRSAQQLMREILGYAPIEPDGSVKIKVPANVPFTISVLDANGRRIGIRHENWLQVKPGEVLECRGCHTAQSELPHGRIAAQAPSANPGAPTAGAFPNSAPALTAFYGESMAETFKRINGTRTPSVNLVFTDEWTDTNVVAAGTAISYLYADLTTTAPTSAGCQTTWASTCRITINYPTHIHPLWSVDRAANTCTNCHAPIDQAMAAQVPAAQLDLGDGASTDEPDHLKSYRELMFNDNEQELVGGTLVDRTVQAVDGNGNPVFQTDNNGNLILDGMGNPIPVLVTVPVTASMSTAGANSSNRFFSVFNTGGTHAGRLTGAELKLLSEWLDIGGQYYNNPFDAPLN